MDFLIFQQYFDIHATFSLLFGRYDGSISPASRAMMAVDQFAWQLGRRNL